MWKCKSLCIERFLQVAIFLALLVLCLFPRQPRKQADETGKTVERTPCSLKAAEQHMAVLREIAGDERVRQWKDESLAAKQAVWILAKAEFALEQAKRIHDPDPKKAREALYQLEDMSLLLTRAAHQSRSGAREIIEEPGSRLRGFRSAIDQSLQTYSLSVPTIYDPTVSWPLIVSMHGHGWFARFQGHPAPRYSGAFCLSPQGRGATDYKEQGEIDVLEAIAEIKREFNIDENRIYLTGSSMGGTGALHLGVHYADQFAGIFPIVGNADNRAWTERWGWNHRFPGRNHDLRHWLQENNTARAFAGNLANLPTYLISGSADTVVPPEHSRYMAAALRRHGAPLEYREFPGVGHGGFSADALAAGLAWTCAWERNPFPRQIRWKSALLRHGRAYWVRFEQFMRPLECGEINAEAVSNTLVRITTANLQAFALQRPAALFRPDRPLLVEIDGQRLLYPITTAGSNPWRMLRRSPIHGWNWQENLPEPGMYKRPGCEGPISEALMDPFVVIVGTQAPDPAMNAAWMREARQFAREWQRRNNAPCLMLKDVDCRPETLSGRNLILFGNSRDNSVSAMLESDLPLREIFEPLRGTTPDLDRPDIGFMLIYPLGHISAGRSLVMLSGNAPEAVWQLWGRFGNWFNWGVYDSRKYFDYAVFDARSAAPESMLLLGWFGTDWSVAGGRSYFGTPFIRRFMAPQQFPRYTDASQVERSELASGALFLTDLMPLRIDQMRGAIGYGRSFNGERTGEHSLGLRAPAVIEYRINGQFDSFSSDVTLHNPLEVELRPIRRNSEKVRFVLHGDGVKLAETTVDWNQPLGKLQAVISNVKILRLETQPAGGPSWLHAGAIWLNPMLSFSGNLSSVQE